MTVCDKMVEIIHKVCDGSPATFEEVVGRSKVQSIYRVRKLAILALHRQGYSLQQIGWVMNRDHTSIGYALADAQGRPRYGNRKGRQ